jgi:WD40 repeat protein
MPPRTLEPVRRLGESPLAQGGQLSAIVAAPTAPRLAVLGNNHRIGVVDVAAGKISASREFAWTIQSAALGDDGHLLAHDNTGVVRVAPDGSSEVVVARQWGVDTARDIDMLVGGDAVVLLVSAGAWPRDDGTFHAEVHRAGAVTATIPYDLADHAAALGLTDTARCSLRINAAALTPDGQRLIVLATVLRITRGSSEALTGAVLIHDLGGRCLHARAVPGDAVYLGNEGSYFHGAIACSPNGQRFAVVLGELRVFDAGGRVVHRHRLRAYGEPIEARKVAWLDDDRVVVAAETCVGVWTPGVEAAHTAQAYRTRAFVLAMGVCATAVAVADDRALLLFARPDLTPIHEAPGHTKAIGALALDATGERVASTDGSTLIVWDVARGVPRFRVPSRCWAGLGFSPDGRELASPIDGQRPHILDADTGAIRLVGAGRAVAIVWGAELVGLHHDEVARDNEIVAELVVSGGREFRELARLPAPYLRCVPALAADGRRALVWSDMAAYGWDLERGVQLWSRPHELVHAALSPDGARALVTRIAAPPAILDMATGDEWLVLKDLGNSISWAVAWSPRRDRIAIGGDDGDVFVIDLGQPGAPRTRLITRHQPNVMTAAFSSDGARLATGGSEGAVCVFDLDA